jgi:hypothetical protein
VNQQSIQELVEGLDELVRLYRALRDMYALAIMGEVLPPCAGCDRLMVPRRQWERLDVAVRPRCLTRAGAQGHCAVCYKRGRDNGSIVPVSKSGRRKGGLTEEEAKRLRRLNRIEHMKAKHIAKRNQTLETA